MSVGHPTGSGASAGSPVAEIAVVIPHYDDLGNLSACLQALLDQSIDRVRFEVIVSDNNSRCERSALESVCRGRARLVDAPLQGAGLARNAGVQTSRAPLLAFLDSDCRPERDWLACGLSALNISPLCGGRVDVAVDDPDAITPAEAFERVFAFNNERYVKQVGFSVTANMFTTRAVFDHVGPFRNGVAEDLDWGRRAVALGYRWHYAADARVSHPARKTWPELVRKARRISREGYVLMREKRFGGMRFLLRNWGGLLALPVRAVQVLRSEKISTPRDRLAALGVTLRLQVWRWCEAHRLIVRGA